MQSEEKGKKTDKKKAPRKSKKSTSHSEAASNTKTSNAPFITPPTTEVPQLSASTSTPMSTTEVSKMSNLCISPQQPENVRASQTSTSFTTSTPTPTMEFSTPSNPSTTPQQRESVRASQTSASFTTSTPTSTMEVSTPSNPSTTAEQPQSIGASQMPDSDPFTNMDCEPDKQFIEDNQPPSATDIDNDMGMIDQPNMANHVLGAKHLHSPASTSLSSPSRDRTKRRKAARTLYDSTDNEGKLIY